MKKTIMVLPIGFGEMSVPEDMLRGIQNRIHLVPHLDRFDADVIDALISYICCKELECNEAEAI